MKIKTIIKTLGGPTRIAEALGITHGAVCQWTKVPVKHCPFIEAWSGGKMTCEQLRPDVYRRLPLRKQ